MKRLMLVILGLAIVGCRSHFRSGEDFTSVTSPDGNNELRLHFNPLGYSVIRGGVTVVNRSRIGMRVDGECLNGQGMKPTIGDVASVSGTLASPVYKKASVDLAANERSVSFGDWSVRLVARNDGVAYRFETELPGRVKVNCEKCEVTAPFGAAPAIVSFTRSFGNEENLYRTSRAEYVRTSTNGWNKLINLPFYYEVGGKAVVVSESDVRDYPTWYLVRPEGGDARSDMATFGSCFEQWPRRICRVGGWGNKPEDWDLPVGGRWLAVRDREDYLVETAGTRTYPWRVFTLADSPAGVLEADAVYALAKPADPGRDFGWVRPGKVAWDWWNCFDNQGDAGCNTKTYERFIDFASQHGVEYVIFDEGWSESLDIWKFHPDVDVPHLLEYAKARKVGIILWMAWAQVAGEEEKVARHFSRLGVKGFKIDFMDRGDAKMHGFLWKFAEACANEKMLVDYHGVVHPSGLNRTYPNVVNFEGVYGLEQLKFRGDLSMVGNDVKLMFTRMVAGPMDYTPGAMRNKPLDSGYRGDAVNPASFGTRSRQMALMALYEAPLQMLCDSPTLYEQNLESFAFMAATPVVWDETVALGGSPDTYVAVARRSGKVWYAAAIVNESATKVKFSADFLGDGSWKAEIFRDAPNSAQKGEIYIHETKTVVKGEELAFDCVPGGGTVIRFTQEQTE